MAKLNLLLVLFFQLILGVTFAEDFNSQNATPVAVEAAGTPPASPQSPAATDSTTAPAPAPPPKPKPKPQKPVCKIVASEGLTSVLWNNRTLTRPTEFFTETINQLKQLVELGYCVHHIQECSVTARNGKSAISIGKEQAALFNPAPLFTIRDLQTLKNAKLKDPKRKEFNLCKMVEPTYSVLTVNGQFAVYIDGNQATEFVSTESAAQESLVQFINPSNWNSLDTSLPPRANPETKSAENKIKNIKCWKGKSLNQQEQNLKLCTKVSKYNQSCEMSLFVHGESTYDVCLQGFEGKPNKVINCFKGNSKAQMKENLAYCKTQLLPGQVCENNPEVHGHEKNEICIIE